MKLKFTGFKKKFCSKILKLSLSKNFKLWILANGIPRKVTFNHRTGTSKRRIDKMSEDSWICLSLQRSINNFPNSPSMTMELYCYQKPTRQSKRKLMLKMDWVQKGQRDCIIVLATKSSYLNHIYGFQSRYTSTVNNF